jgi:chromosomal replication initiation ATPase DnaA
LSFLHIKNRGSLVLSRIWQDFLTIIREEMGSRVVETWLKAVSLCQWDQDKNTIYVQAPNVFVKDWIQTKYADVFRTHLSRLFNAEVDIKVVF